MSSLRSVLSATTVIAAVLGGGWYAPVAVPIVSAASAGEQTAVTTAPAPATKPITPENPIPRRLSSVPIPYPRQFLGPGYVATVVLRVTLDASGSVADTSIAHTATGSATAPAPRGTEIQAFIAAATDAVTQWRYQSPEDPPIEFFVSVRFDADRDGVATQSDTLPGGGSSTGTQATALLPRMTGPGRISGQPVRVGGNIRPPAKTTHVNPTYPEAALAASVEGVVIVEATIDEQGQIAEARVLRSIPLLDQAALAAVTQWEYTPTLLNGRPVPVIMTVTVQFLSNQQRR